MLFLDKSEFVKRIGVMPEAVKAMAEKSKEKRYLYFRQVVTVRQVNQQITSRTSMEINRF